MFSLFDSLIFAAMAGRLQTQILHGHVAAVLRGARKSWKKFLAKQMQSMCAHKPCLQPHILLKYAADRAKSGESGNQKRLRLTPKEMSVYLGSRIRTL